MAQIKLVERYSLLRCLTREVNLVFYSFAKVEDLQWVWTHWLCIMYDNGYVTILWALILLHSSTTEVVYLIVPATNGGDVGLDRESLSV